MSAIASVAFDPDGTIVRRDDCRALYRPGIVEMPAAGNGGRFASRRSRSTERSTPATWGPKPEGTQSLRTTAGGIQVPSMIALSAQ